ncbi:hypothetical protein CDAR_378741 [Caerostris darwini]|uniref:Uncharacterized protein n=1 Tax=Caerostris darwini TaxID=1538125 RepID=A0AAV4MWH5_9ARAC|nr:hypothetical protein CDAR_378741 [Caerostris darwini]
MPFSRALDVEWRNVNGPNAGAPSASTREGGLLGDGPLQKGVRKVETYAPEGRGHINHPTKVILGYRERKISPSIEPHSFLSSTKGRHELTGN